MTTDEKSKGRNLLKLALLLIGIVIVAVIILSILSAYFYSTRSGLYVSCTVYGSGNYVEVHAERDLSDVNVEYPYRDPYGAPKCRNVKCEFSSIKQGNSERCYVPFGCGGYVVSAANEKNFTTSCFTVDIAD